MFLIKEGSYNSENDTFTEIKITEDEKDRPKFKYFHLDKKEAEWIYKNDVTER